MRTSKLFAFLLSVAALTLVMVPAFASGSGSSADPQATNVPYVAWAGEQVRVEKCLFFQNGPVDDARVAELKAALNVSLLGTFTVEDWSGVDEVNAGPKFIGATGGVVPVQLKVHPEGLCWAADISSQKPGLAVIRLNVALDVLGEINSRIGPIAIGLGDVSLLHAQILNHQFVTIWMQSQAPSIAEIATTGDPAGDGVFPPILDTKTGLYDFHNGLVKLTVKGTFPLGNDFAGRMPGNAVTLPDDWPALAGKFALDDSASLGGVPGSSPLAWDIHDTMHVLPPDEPIVDPTPFSWDPHSLIGPFDPVRVSAMPWTSIADGVLTTDDAPMPALRVDVNLAAGSAGSLETALKTDIYYDSVKGYYAPYYRAYLPPAGAIDGPLGVASGVSGALWNNNSPGFLSDGKYTFWNVAGFKSTDPLRGPSVCRDEQGNLRPSPYGWDHVAVYTDEHGEAWVQFNPNTGFNFVIDGNNRCDLPAPGSTIGTATITATSIYPDQPVLWDGGNKTSNALQKKIISMASKTLSCVKKGTNEAFCVEKILDIKGNPVAGAPVKFTATSPSTPNVDADGVLFGGFDTRGQDVIASDPAGEYVTIATNAKGQAGVAVTLSQNECVNIDTENLGTKFHDDMPGVKRFTDFNPHLGTVCGSTPVVTPVAAPTGSSSTPPTVAAPAAAPGTGSSPVVIAAPDTPRQAAAVAKLSSIKIAKISAKRYVMVKVISPEKTASLHLRLVDKHGTVQKNVVRSVKTNALVRVPNLTLGKSIVKVRALVLG